MFSKWKREAQICCLACSSHYSVSQGLGDLVLHRLMSLHDLCCRSSPCISGGDSTALQMDEPLTEGGEKG